MEIFVIFFVFIIIAISLFGLYKLITVMYSGKNYTYKMGYDEDGVEVETVVDWSDTKSSKNVKEYFK